MNYHKVGIELGHNKEVFKALLHGAEKEQYLWKPSADKWCMLEILCHLYDEECEDFRPRIDHILYHQDQPMVPIDPQEWVTSRKYMEQDYEKVLHAFLAERQRSINYLNSLSLPEWGNVYVHPKLGPITASMLLYNWLAHDYHHIRQINALKYEWLKSRVTEPLTYAGNW
jgi:hypothetical protein